MKQTPIVFRVDQGQYNVVFSLKQITVADDSNFLQKFIDIADEDRADAAYKIKAEILADWAAPFPDGLKNKEGKKIKRPDDVLDNAEAVQKFFAEADVDKDWISEFAVNALRQRHSPTVSFF